MTKNEKRFWIGTGIWGAVVIAVSIINNVVLLSMHPLAYYYTLDGIKLSAALGSIEVPVLIGIGLLHKNLCVKPLAKDLNEAREVIKKM